MRKDVGEDQRAALPWLERACPGWPLTNGLRKGSGAGRLSVVGHRALVVGATGLVGEQLVSELLSDPHSECVQVLVRRPYARQHERLHERVIDFDKLSELELQAVDRVYCCLGTTLSEAGSREAFRRVDYDYPLQIAELAKKGGITGYSLVSALGADPRSRLFYNRVKGQVEQGLGQLAFPSLHIFRPSLLLGQRNQKRRGEAAAQVGARVVQGALVGPLRKYRAIEAATVAKAMVRAAFDPSLSTLSQVFESDRIQQLGNAKALL